MGEAEATVGRVTPDWVLIDVGNTHIKTGLFFDGELASVALQPFSASLHDSLGRMLGGATQVAVASVNPAALGSVKNGLRSFGLNPTVILQSDGTIFRSGAASTDVKSPETTGVDRVLGCLGALLESPNEAVVTVDCGTATTINVMTPDRRFRGGMIAPGRRLLARALRTGTAMLPEIVPDATHVEIGRSTTESLNAGVTAAFIGCIRECTTAALKAFPASRVFLTGGDSEFAHRVFPEFVRVNWLTLKGLHWYAMQTAHT
jgi:type III pantothenate kinase